jgi:NADPH:quinone reductase-like Zn-dependent oxidoreductase
LIWGGSTVTGQFTIQLAKLSGLRVIAVTSAKTRDLAARLGAEDVVVRDDKTNDQIAAEVRAICHDNLTLAIDIVGNSTAASCLQALSHTKECRLAALAFLKADEHVPDNVTIAQVEMKRFVIDSGNRPYAEELNHLVGSGRIGMPDLDVLKGGLESVERGLSILKAGDMTGRKLVVKM